MFKMQKKPRVKVFKNGYKIDRYIINLCFLLIMLLFFITLIVEGAGNNVYINCPDNEPRCFNPVYGQCDNPVTEPYCDIEYLNPGDELGIKPGWLFINSVWIYAVILLSGLVINHLVYNRGRRLW